MPFSVTISCTRDLSFTYNTTFSLVKQSEWEVSSTIVKLNSIFPEPFGLYIKNNNLPFTEHFPSLIDRVRP